MENSELRSKYCLSKTWSPHMDFEWHDVKNAENFRKHGIDFSWAIRVFDDPNVFEYDDDDPEEDRVNAIGLIESRLIHVTYTMRDDVYRMISASVPSPKFATTCRNFRSELRRQKGH